MKRHILRLSSSESAKKSATLNKMQNSRKFVIVLTILRLFYHKSGNFLSFLCHALRPLSCLFLQQNAIPHNAPFLRSLKQLWHNGSCYYTIGNWILPQCNLSCNAQVNSCSYHTQCLEHPSHSWYCYAITSFQPRNLRSFYTDAFPQLFLGQVLFNTSFFDSLA